MNKLFFSLLIILTLSCSPQEAEIDYAVFSGKIENQISNVITVSGRDFEQEIKVSKDGVFRDTLRGISPGYYNFSDKRESSTLYLEPGYDIALNFNAKEFDETIQYTGHGAANSNFLAKKNLTIEEIRDTLKSYRAFFSLDEAAFLAKAGEIKTVVENQLSESKDLSPNFIELEKKSIQYDYLLSIQRFPGYHAHYADNETFEPSKNFSAPVDEIDFTNEKDFESITSYHDLVMSHHLSKIEEISEPALIFEAFRKIESQVIKEELLKNLARKISPSNEDNEIYYSNIVGMSKDEEFKAELTKSYTAIKVISVGMPSPVFTNYENHKGGTTSLSDFKGKYVYIDIWATWCGPCLKEIPHLKEVERNFHDKNIEFVSISVDRERAHGTWVNMVTEKELTGQQLFHDAKSNFTTKYVVKTIPRFILIGPDGNIVRGDAPRPSSPELAELLGTLDL